MIRSKVLFPYIMLGLIAFVFLSGCCVEGEDGTSSYMAVDLVYAPQQLYFQAMPSFGQVGEHYQQPEGTYPEPTGIESGSLERARADQLGFEPSPSRSAEVSNQQTTLDESDYDLDDPQEYLFESQGPGYSLRIEGHRYPSK